MATASSELSVVARGDREIVMKRDFAAPRQLVFRAFTEPALVSRWFGPPGWSVPVCEIDLRPGGKYRYVMRKDDDGTEIVMAGTYREIVRPERLVTTEAFQGFSEVGWRPEDVTVSTVVLTERVAGTTWTLTTVYPSKAVRDAALENPYAAKGMSDSFERLDAVLRSVEEQDT